MTASTRIQTAPASSSRTSNQQTDLDRYVGHCWQPEGATGCRAKGGRERERLTWGVNLFLRGANCWGYLGI